MFILLQKLIMITQQEKDQWIHPNLLEDTIYQKRPKDDKKASYDSLKGFLEALGERWQQLETLEHFLHIDPQHLERRSMERH